jgi:tetratricopeptide (TPR) repeat protein
MRLRLLFPYFWTIMLAWCFQYLLWSSLVLPHGDLDQRILLLTDRIHDAPHDMSLRMERGELYLQHEDYLLAKNDFSTCLQHHFENTRVLLGMSQSLFYSDSPDSALIMVDRALKMEPYHLSAMEWKGNVLEKLGRYCDAGLVLHDFLKIASDAGPMIYMQATSCLSACRGEESIHEAIEILQDGLKKMPGNKVLQRKLISIHLQNGDYASALCIQSDIIAASTFKTRAYYERATTYASMNESALAISDLTSALATWDALPPKKKDLDAIRDLKAEINLLLQQLQD